MTTNRNRAADIKIIPTPTLPEDKLIPTPTLPEDKIILIPTPGSASPRPEDVPEFDPDYIYTDRDGDEWERVDGRWVTGGTHDERVGTRVGSRGYVSLPEEYGPYRKGRLASEAAEQDAEQVFDPAYAYRDKDGDTWEFLNHNWRCTDYGRDATNYLVPPAKYGPYTRIEKENHHDH